MVEKESEEGLMNAKVSAVCQKQCHLGSIMFQSVIPIGTCRVGTFPRMGHDCNNVCGNNFARSCGAFLAIHWH